MHIIQKTGIIWTIVMALSLVAKAQRNTKPIDQYLHKLHLQGSFDGVVLAAQKGKIVYQKGFGLASREWNIVNDVSVKFSLFSVSKSFTAVRVLQLVQAGKISLQTTIQEVFPEYPHQTGKAVTIHQLLSHTSGFPDFVNPTLVPLGQALTQEVFLKAFYQIKPTFSPGTRFAYANSTYVLLSFIIEKITGQSFKENLQEHIFKKLGMQNSGVETPGEIIRQKATDYLKKGKQVYNIHNFLRTPMFKGAGAIYATAKDLLKWDQALYDHTLLSKKLTNQMLTSGTLQKNYGYGWGIAKVPRLGKVFAHIGGAFDLRSLVVRIPKSKTLIVILSNTGLPFEDIWPDIVEQVYKSIGKDYVPLNLEERLSLE